MRRPIALVLGFVFSALVFSTMCAPSARALELRAFGTLNMSSWSLDPPLDNLDGITKPGFGAMITTAPIVGGLFGIQTGILYTPIGAALGSNGEAVWNKYFQVPALFKFTIPLISAGLGPYFGFPVGSGSDTPNVSSQGDTGDFGVMGMLGFKYPVASFDMQTLNGVLDIAYQRGLVTVGGQSSENPNRNFMIMLGVAYDIL